jgi:hypothetical protein
MMSLLTNDHFLNKNFELFLNQMKKSVDGKFALINHYEIVYLLKFF